MTEEELAHHIKTMAGAHVYFEALKRGVHDQADEQISDEETESYCDCRDEENTDTEWEHAHC